MITAVDTSVLLDILGPDPVFGPASANAIRASTAQGRLVACEIVWAELVAHFPSPAAMREAMARLDLEFSAVTEESALEAGSAWKEHRKRGGSRSRLVPDFLVGAHALRQADRLLTRDRGFYRTYFKKLSVLDPTARK
jgi:predicted nucleic acid-binding protein